MYHRHMFTKTVPTVYQQCTNRQKQSKTVKQQKMTIGVPIVTWLHRVRRIQVRVRVCRPRPPNTQSRLRVPTVLYLANGNKTCPGLLLFTNNNMARESQGYVRRSSRNVAHV